MWGDMACPLPEGEDAAVTRPHDGVVDAGGHKFAAAVLAMLEREEHWIRWKANGCQAFDTAAALTRAAGVAAVSAPSALPLRPGAW